MFGPVEELRRSPIEITGERMGRREGRGREFVSGLEFREMVYRRGEVRDRLIWNWSGTVVVQLLAVLAVPLSSTRRVKRSGVLASPYLLAPVH